MSFLDELCGFLRSVRDGEVRELRLSNERLAHHRRELEAWFDNASRVPHADANQLRHAYSWWLRRCEDGLLESLYEHVLLAFPAPPLPLFELVGTALAELVDEDRQDVFSSRTPRPDLEDRLGSVRAQSLSHAAQAAAASYKRRLPVGVSSNRRTCELLRLTRTRDSALELTPAGALLLRVERRERLRWLLAVELTNPDGLDRRDRLDPELARRLVRTGELVLDGYSAVWLSALAQAREHESVAPLKRWTALGILTHRVVDVLSGADVGDDDRPQVPPDDVYSLTDLGRSLLLDLLSEGPHPLRELARAVVEDEDAGVPGDLRWPVQAGVQASGLSRYTKMLTHELRNALMPAQHASQMLQDTAFDEGARHRLAVIEAALTRTFDFVDRWRTVMEQAEEAGEPFLVLQAVRDAQAAVRHECEQDIALRVGTAADEAMVHGKRDLFTQAIVELLRNAVQVCGPSVSIEIAVERDLDRVVVKVTDDGDGVPPELREQVFQRGFFARPGGTGHGLADVLDTVRAMSGDIRVVDGPSGGACFVITLPIYAGRSS